MNIFTKPKFMVMLIMLLGISFLVATTRDESDAKGLSSLSITAQVEYGSNSTNFILNRINSTTYNMESFTYNSATLEYNYTTTTAAAYLNITFPTSGAYKLKAEYFGSSTVTTFAEEKVTGVVTVPLRYAETSAGMATDGNPNAHTQNNVLTIVSDPGGTNEETYTLRFRRRAENVPTSIDNVIRTGNIFTCDINVDNSTINGDAISSYEDVVWSVNSDTGTAYFTGNQMTPLSNGDITVTATLKK